MSEEEKKAIEWLKNTSLDELEYENDMRSIDIVLNLVENLQKEIEELKKPKYLVHFENNKITKMELINDYISKDKIRAKIKELEDNMILFTNYKEKFNRYKYARDILEKTLGE